VSSKQLISEEELLDLYASGIRDFTAYEINFVVPGAMNLSGVDFRGQSLAECDFSGLSGAEKYDTQKLNTVTRENSILSANSTFFFKDAEAGGGLV
jgi:hypothetical protein